MIPDGVSRIYETAFYGCTSLRKVQLPDNLEYINEMAFFGCTSLMELTIPENTICGDSIYGLAYDDLYNEYVIDGATIYSFADSPAEAYANNYGIAFAAINTITYDLNGGKNNSANPTIYVAGEKTITLSDPTRTGYTFSGWYNEAGKKVTKITKSTTGNQKLTAQWTANTYTLKYNSNGATSGTMKNESGKTYGTSFNLTTNAYKRTGYTFAGWNTKKDGTGTAYADKSSVKNLTSTADGTVILFAQWTPNTYTVKFNANGGTGAMSALTGKAYGTSFNLTANAYKRTGYTFAGWNTKKDGSGTSYTNKASVKNLTSTNGGTVTLYAQWKKN